MRARQPRRADDGWEAKAGPLSAEQKQLVADNLGMVATGIRRYRRITGGNVVKQWQDLFQEGCLALIRAAQEYQASPGTTFAAFANQRVLYAIGQAARRYRAATTQRAFRLVRAEQTERACPNRRKSAKSAHNRTAQIVRLVPLTRDLVAQLAAPACKAEDGDGDTLGARIRVKYERAVQQAASRLIRGSASRLDRQTVVKLVVRERFLVPDVDTRSSLRRLAREARLSYARLAHADAHLLKLIREILEHDAEFKCLRTMALAHPLGMRAVPDAHAQEVLADARRAGVMHRLAQLPRDKQGQCLLRLMGAAGLNLEAVAKLCLALADRNTEQTMWEETAPWASATAECSEIIQ